MNTAFLQLEGGDLEKKLSLGAQQLHELCKNGGERWARDHDACFLLTHHPPNWLDKEGEKALRGEIAPPGRFALHLYGHQHEGHVAFDKRGGAQGRLEILGRALFGLEHWGKDGADRLHGYSAGEIRFEGTARRLRIWPRAGYKRQAGHWGLDKDISCELDAEESLSEEIGNNPHRPVAALAPVALPLPTASPVPVVPPVAPVPPPIAPSAAPVPHPSSGPLGWTLVDAAFLSTEESRASLSPQTLTRYFDGQVPGLRHALCPGIPRRAVVARVVAKFQESAEGETPAMVVLLGGGGEGKTTALLQATADLARSDNTWKVLWRPDAETPLCSDDVRALGPGPWLLAADDADGLVKPLSEAVQALGRAGRTDVHLLLATRDTDWDHARGWEFPWDSHIGLVKERLRGVNEADAALVIRAWSALGTSGLGALAREKNEKAQIAALLAAARKPAVRDDGSFFGGVMEVRFDAAGLRAHVQELMNRLAERAVTAGHTLKDAFVYVAALDAVGIEGLDTRVLADLMEVPRTQVGARVILALGEEAAAVLAALRVRTRHRSIAKAVLTLAETGAALDLAEVFARMVRQVKRTVDSGVHVGDDGWHGKMLHLGPTLAKELPLDLAVERREAIAVAAARASIEADPDHLSRHVTLARTWRELKQYAHAVAALRVVAPRLGAMVDHDTDVRGFWYEWSVCEGSRGNHALNVVLAGYSLSDALNLPTIELTDAKLVLAGLGAAFMEIVKHDPEIAFLRGLRAASELGSLTAPDPKAQGFFERYAAAANKVPAPTFADAITWLAQAVEMARKRVPAGQIPLKLPRKPLSFELLRTTLAPRSARPPHRK